MLETRELMEEFRGLLNLEVPERKLISFVFFGLPEIEKNLKLDPPLAQRVAFRYKLEPFTAESTEAYVKHRLRLAGSPRMPFTLRGAAGRSTRPRAAPRASSTPCATTPSSRPSWRARSPSTRSWCAAWRTTWAWWARPLPVPEGAGQARAPRPAAGQAARRSTWRRSTAISKGSVSCSGLGHVQPSGRAQGAAGDRSPHRGDDPRHAYAPGLGHGLHAGAPQPAGRPRAGRGHWPVRAGSAGPEGDRPRPLAVRARHGHAAVRRGSRRGAARASRGPCPASWRWTACACSGPAWRWICPSRPRRRTRTEPAPCALKPLERLKISRLALTGAQVRVVLPDGRRVEVSELDVGWKERWGVSEFDVEARRGVVGLGPGGDELALGRLVLSGGLDRGSSSLLELNRAEVALDDATRERSRAGWSRCATRCSRWMRRCSCRCARSRRRGLLPQPGVRAPVDAPHRRRAGPPRRASPWRCPAATWPMSRYGPTSLTAQAALRGRARAGGEADGAGGQRARRGARHGRGSLRTCPVELRREDGRTRRWAASWRWRA